MQLRNQRAFLPTTAALSCSFINGICTISSSPISDWLDFFFIQASDTISSLALPPWNM